MCFCNFCESLRTARLIRGRGLSLFFLNNLDSRVKTKGGWFFILGFNMLNFQICFPVNRVETQHVKHNFYRHLLFWFIYRLLFWNFRHRLVRLYWYESIAEASIPLMFVAAVVAGKDIESNLRAGSWRTGFRNALRNVPGSFSCIVIIVTSACPAPLRT